MCCSFYNVLVKLNWLPGIQVYRYSAFLCILFPDYLIHTHSHIHSRISFLVFVILIVLISFTISFHCFSHFFLLCTFVRYFMCIYISLFMNEKKIHICFIYIHSPVSFILILCIVTTAEEPWQPSSAPEQPTTVRDEPSTDSYTREPKRGLSRRFHDDEPTPVRKVSSEIKYRAVDDEPTTRKPTESTPTEETPRRFGRTPQEPKKAEPLTKTPEPTSKAGRTPTKTGETLKNVALR